MNLSIRCLKALYKIFLFFICTLFITCKESQLPFNNASEAGPDQPKQGVNGKVIYKEGNFDSNDNLISNGKIVGVSRKIYFYELSGLREVETNDGSFITMIHSTVIDSTKSDKNGNFLVALKPGKYSLFIQENERIYSQIGDEGLYYPVTVFKDSVTNITLYIDYKAHYSE
jgi:hypothetical protein